MPEVAAYLGCRIQSAFVKAKLAEYFVCFCRYGDIPWRSGVSGSIMTHGHITRSIAHNLHLIYRKRNFQGVFLHSDGMSDERESKYDMLIKFTNAKFPEPLTTNRRNDVKGDREDDDNSDDGYDSEKDLENSPTTRARQLVETIQSSNLLQNATHQVNIRSRYNGMTQNLAFRREEVNKNDLLRAMDSVPEMSSDGPLSSLASSSNIRRGSNVFVNTGNRKDSNIFAPSQDSAGMVGTDQGNRTSILKTRNQGSKKGN
jgi:hypothetical protein